MTRPAGIATLADLKARCHVDPATGCWLWPHAPGASMPPTVWYRRPDGRIAGSSVRRAAMQLAAGVVLGPDVEVTAAHCCTAPDCCCPAHSITLTRSERAALMGQRSAQARQQRRQQRGQERPRKRPATAPAAPSAEERAAERAQALAGLQEMRAARWRSSSVFRLAAPVPQALQGAPR